MPNAFQRWILIIGFHYDYLKIDISKRYLEDDFQVQLLPFSIAVDKKPAHIQVIILINIKKEYFRTYFIYDKFFIHIDLLLDKEFLNIRKLAPNSQLYV